uniref:Uncharacterized protein n=1 Tax=Tanacetum cinerariifolium TaxID=118510 RepID=A0A6L2KA27_TANCI|nr:hypothetical protein [Tanacetum cinerariifolium]
MSSVPFEILRLGIRNEQNLFSLNIASLDSIILLIQIDSLGSITKKLKALKCSAYPTKMHSMPLSPKVFSVGSGSFITVLQPQTLSLGTPAGRVILFGIIPTTISDTTPVIAPPTTETPIIAPTIPPSPDYTPASPDYSPASETESDLSEDPSSGHIPPLPAPIPHGRPYRYHPNGPVHMMTARKRVRPLHVQHHFVDHSSSDSSSRHSSSDHSSLDLPSTSAGPSHKRRRSPMTSVPALPLVSGALSPIRADLIPSPKRVRDIGYLADVEVGPRKTRVERVTHPAMPEDIPELLRREQQRRLRGTASVESQRVDRLQRGMSRMQREMRKMRRFRFYDRVRVGRLEACARKHMDYHL